MADPMATRLAAMARRLILKHGRDLTLIGANALGDASKPWRSGSNPETVAIFGVIVEFDASEIDGDGVKRGDRQCFANMPSTATDWQRFLKITDSLDNSSWRIVTMSPIQPGTLPITYTMHLRM